MTGPYDWNPMPHVLDIRCPKCDSLSVFEFAESVRIRRRTDIAAFKRHPHLQYEFVESRLGNRFHQAVFFAGIGVSSASNLRDLPDGYMPEDWEHSKYLNRYNPVRGTVRCSSCGLRSKHELDWPLEAAYSVNHKGRLLWAFHRESALELRRYIASTRRNRNDYKWRFLLRHVPSHFLGAKDRERVVELLDRLLRRETW